MNRLGRTDAKLTPFLNRAIGRQSGAPEYDPDKVAKIVAAVRGGKGDAKRGAAVYQMAQLACTACHRVGDAGGVIGPSLNGVGAVVADRPRKDLDRPTYLRRMGEQRESMERLAVIADDEWDVPTFLRKQTD